ncbi:MAG: efflux RND transporter periplasmic adaptor subunit [Gammaproteobacteria bacterium]|nr:efflux RND transporter periplasmic adaptor subunit [Gammaproteobacteria bacterium]
MRKIIIAVFGILTCCAAAAQSMDAQPRREATGVVMPSRSVALAAKIMGRINTIHHQEGEGVTDGELLISLNDAELRADLASVQASLGEAKAELKHAGREEARIRKLYRAKTLSQDELEDAALIHTANRERLKMAQAAVAKAQAQLNEAQIKAPFAGIITQKDAEIGQVTQPGTMLLVLEDHSRLKLRTKVKERDIPHIELGQTVSVTIDALSSKTLLGTVSKIIPSGDLSTHAFVVETTLPRLDKLYPGMFGKASFNQ